jgi:poly(3-hydroxybutyrate) depolymerase
MKGGGHTLPHLFPRIQGALGKRFIGNVCADVEVVDEVWTFFSAHLE